MSEGLTSLDRNPMGKNPLDKGTSTQKQSLQSWPAGSFESKQNTVGYAGRNTSVYFINNGEFHSTNVTDKMQAFLRWFMKGNILSAYNSARVTKKF